jgi:tRNA dimethylallyltransferase
VAEGWSIPEVPPNDDLREQLEADAELVGNEAFHHRLSQIDPDAAAKIHPNNVRRVVRALEVYLETGTPISILQQKKPPPYRIRTIGLQMERDALYERADKRVDMMIEAGSVEEVQQLLTKGYDPALPSMSALGYRELADHLQGKQTLEAAIELTKYSTHNFIRRQEIWFRGHDNGILWHNEANVEIEKLVHAIKTWMQE